jgi:cytoskeletal protein RodZ
MFRLYRMVRGLSLRDVAPQIGIGHATLMRIETGQAFDAETLLKVWTWMLAPEDAVSRHDP